MVRLYKFKAEWCEPCKKLTSVLADATKTLGDDYVVVVTEVDVEAEPDLAEKYRVLGIPTIVKVDEAGTKLDHKIGVASVSELVEWIKQ